MTVIITLFLAGMILIVAEFFLPGGIMGILGFLLIVASTVTGVMNYPEYSLFIIMGEVLGLVIGVAIGMYILAKTPVGNVIVLGDTMSSAAGYSSPSVDPALKGQFAIAHTTLRPAGTIMVGDQRVDAVSDGTFIDAGAKVKIITVEGHRVVVELADDEAEGGAA